MVTSMIPNVNNVFFNKSIVDMRFLSAYNPLINYTWEMLPNAKVKNSGTSGVDLQLYSGNPLDFQGTQGIQVNKSFTLSGNAISLYLGFDTDSIAITHTLAEFDNLKVSIVNATLKVTINAVEHNVATIALNTYYQTEIVINSNNLTVKLNGTQTYSASCTALNTTILKSLGANDGLASGRFDGQFDYFIVYNGLTTFSLANQFFKDMSTNSNTLFATDFRGNSSNIKDYKSGTTYPITNYSATQRTNFTQVNKGLQDLMIERDSNGFFVGLRDFPKGNSIGTANTGWVPDLNSDFTIEWIQHKLNYNWAQNTGKSYYVGGSWVYNNNDFYFGEGLIGSFIIKIGSNSVSIDNDFEPMVADKKYLITCSFIASTKILTMTINDGLFTKSSTITTFVSSGKSVYLFNQYNQHSANINPLTTELRLLKVHNKILTQEEVTKNYNSYEAQGLLA